MNSDTDSRVIRNGNKRVFVHSVSTSCHRKETVTACMPMINLNKFKQNQSTIVFLSDRLNLLR